ncbi:MAG: tetratricopeptide repeat protein [Candidatus Acetothermia bacterium]|jgi:parvulin-like peptidyl-prolyl isomerase/predicted negative regulator of RcsB-dependent stress response|nr:tetratricopeptide repeat protein [Candidatus Acetothermia bacterium]MDH7504612.1 tetratricopeptide repeat protein [Candidatus Acetothermia bacterium]
MRRLIEKYGKYIIWAIAISFLLGALVIFTPGRFNIARQGSPQSRETALIVNGEKVTQGQLDQQYQSLLNYYRQLYSQAQMGRFDSQLQGASGARYQLQLKADVAQDLIRRTILNQEARKRGITVSKAEYEAELTKEVRSQLQWLLSYYQMTEDELRERLAEGGRTLDDFKKDIRKELEKHEDELKKRIQDEKLKAAVVGAFLPTDDELREYFEENKPQFASPEMVRARHILIKVPEEAPEAGDHETEATTPPAEEAKGRTWLDELDPDLAARLGPNVRGWASRNGKAKLNILVTHTDGTRALVQGTSFSDERAEWEYIKRLVACPEVKLVQEAGLLTPRPELILKTQEEAERALCAPSAAGALQPATKEGSPAATSAEAKARARIEEIKRQLDAGADFAELAKQYSEDEGTAQKGGDLGWFQRGQMVKEFEEAAFALQVGQLSGIVRTQYGFHIIKLEDRRPASTFEEVKDQVRSAYLSEKKEDQFTKWYQQTRDAATVEIKVPLLQAYLLEQEDKDKALAAYEQLAAEGKVADLYLPYYIARLYEEKLREAEDERDALASTAQPDDPRLKTLEAQIAEYSKKVKDNLYKTLDAAGSDQALFEELLTYDEQNPELHYRYGQFLEEMGRYNEALKQLDRALELKPDHAGSLILYGDIKLDAKEYDEAIAKYQQALPLIAAERERLKRVRTRLAQAYMGRGENDPAVELLSKVLADSPDDQQVLTLMGDILFGSGKFAEAASYYKKALESGVKPELQVKLANAYLKAGSPKEAGELFDAVIKGQSFYAADAYLGLGDVHRAEGLTEKALDDYREGFKRSQYRTQLREELGERILELNPEDTATRFDLAKAYKTNRAYDKAIAHYLELLKRQPQSFDAHQALAETYTAKEDYANAKAIYKKAVSLTDDQARKILVWQKVLESEEKLVGAGNKLGEDGLEALLEMARLYLSQGNTAKAQEQLDRLEKEDPSWRAEEVGKLKAELSGP